MAPAGTAIGGGARQFWFSLKLVVPHHVVETAIVEFVVGCTHRILLGRARTASALGKLRVFAAGKHKLLTAGICLHAAAEGAALRLRLAVATAGEFDCVEFEDKPPVNCIAFRKVRNWAQ